MSQQPKVPGRPAGTGGNAPNRSVPTRPKPAGGGPAPSQQALRDKARQGQNDDGDEEEEYEEEDGVLAAWLRQSPSWLTSMVFHMILLLVLALWALPGEKADGFKEITLGEPEIVEEELEEEQNEDLNEELEPNIQSEADIVVEDVSPVDFEVDAPEVEIPNEHDEKELAAPTIELSEFATNNAITSSLLNGAGYSKSGLGGRNAAGRAAAVRAGGGSPGSESAVEAATEKRPI